VTTTPHWPQPRVNGAIGVGAALPPGILIDASGNIVLPDPNQILSYLPQGFLALGTQAISAVQGAMGVIQGAAPAIGLVETIAAGSAPDPQMVVGALSATVALVNPVAGAIVGAVGEALIGLQSAAQSLFQALGLISPPPVTYAFRGGINLSKHEPIPYGRDDPNWKEWGYFASPAGFSSNGLPYVYTWQNILSQENAASATSNFYMESLLYAINRYGEMPQPNYQIGPTGSNDFEKFFFEMLRKDFENWWNANPSIPPRDLLMGAASIWNHTHQPDGAITYSSGNATRGGVNDPIAWLLSQWGDITLAGQEAPPLTVSMGPFIASPAQRKTLALKLPARPDSAAAPSSSMSTGAKVAVGAAIVAGGTLVGSGVYAMVKKKSIGQVWSGAWRKVRRG
jgi:hypothetical protein